MKKYKFIKNIWLYTQIYRNQPANLWKNTMKCRCHSDMLGQERTREKNVWTQWKLIKKMIDFETG